MCGPGGPGGWRGWRAALGCCGPTVSPGHQGASGAFLSCTRRAALSMPRVLCPSSEARMPGPESVVGLSVAPSSTCPNPANATGTLIFCPRHSVGLLAPDPGRSGLTSLTRPRDLGQSRRAPWKRRREPSQKPAFAFPSHRPHLPLLPPTLPRSPQSSSALGYLEASWPGVPLGRP